MLDSKNKKNAWDVIQIARHPKRPTFMDYVKSISQDFKEIHGDRLFRDDHSVLCGFAYIETFKVLLIGNQKGKDIQDNLLRNFGMAKPEGYRKALRAMKIAEKFNIPIITLIDTPGAYPGIDAEERGQAFAIAENIFEMQGIKVPIISVIIGEGGSGGALALAVANVVLMFENSIYSVISPEGCASILWKNESKVKEAAEALKLRSWDLLEFEIINEIIPEPKNGAHENLQEAGLYLKEYLLKYLHRFSKFSPSKLIKQRHENFLKMGGFSK